MVRAVLGAVLRGGLPKQTALALLVVAAAVLVALAVVVLGRLLLIGLTRIYLGAHWASDVFAGWSVGAAWAMALWLFAYAIERRQRLHDAPLQDAPSTNV